MREIIFRGKRIDNGEWAEGYFIKWYDGTASIETGKYCVPMFDVIPETVGQYTGLTDKNGTKIFDGDIIRGGWVLCGCEILPVVAFKDGVFGLAWNGGREFSAFTSMSNIEYEVIGNIYDNPDCGARMGGDTE